MIKTKIPKDPRRFLMLVQFQTFVMKLTLAMMMRKKWCNDMLKLKWKHIF